ncbi:MAG: hypothetical protein QM736_18870 [Vicinamibacterales bacterium]
MPVLSATSQGTELFTFDAAARLLDSVRLAADNRVARVLLIPFMTLVRPLSAPTPTQFVVTIVPAAAVLLVLVAWLIAADARSVALTDAAIERQVTTPTARARAYAARSIRWQLHPAGAPELAFVWKAMLQTFRTVDRRVLLRIALVLLWLVFASLLVTRASGPLLLGGGANSWGALFAVFHAAADAQARPASGPRASGAPAHLAGSRRECAAWRDSLARADRDVRRVVLRLDGHGAVAHLELAHPVDQQAPPPGSPSSSSAPGSSSRNSPCTTPSPCCSRGGCRSAHRARVASTRSVSGSCCCSATGSGSASRCFRALQ